MVKSRAGKPQDLCSIPRLSYLAFKLVKKQSSHVALGFSSNRNALDIASSAFYIKCFLELDGSGVVAAVEQPGAFQWERLSWLPLGGRKIRQSLLLVLYDHR